jgi:hypothetical protein
MKIYAVKEIEHNRDILFNSVSLAKEYLIQHLREYAEKESKIENILWRGFSGKDFHYEIKLIEKPTKVIVQIYNLEDNERKLYRTISRTIREKVVQNDY